MIKIQSSAFWILELNFWFMDIVHAICQYMKPAAYWTLVWRKYTRTPLLLKTSWWQELCKLTWLPRNKRPNQEEGISCDLDTQLASTKKLCIKSCKELCLLYTRWYSGSWEASMIERQAHAGSSINSQIAVSYGWRITKTSFSPRTTSGSSPAWYGYIIDINGIREQLQ